jgi:hypothetical protein
MSEKLTEKDRSTTVCKRQEHRIHPDTDHKMMLLSGSDS